jgi:hypothetical protein
MGIFDKNTKKRKGDDFDSPVEQIDLSNATASSGSYGRAASDDDDDRRQVAASPASPAARSAAIPASPAASPAAAPAPRRASGSYGIDDAIALMRTLPSENVELVVQVVKHTLESTRIEIGTIIEDATDKQSRIDGRIKVLRGEIASYEQEIATRRKEIESLEADHRETTMVKDRLQLAERLTKGETAVAAPRPNRTTGDLPRAKSTTQPPTVPAVTAPSAAPSGATISSGSGTSVAGGYVAPSPSNGPSSPPTSAASESSGPHRMPTHTVVKK